MSRTYFFWDPLSDNIFQERDESGTVTAEYTTEPALYGNLISQNRGGVESQYNFDPQGSTLALTDDNQQVTDTYAYTAFGEVTEHTGNTVNPFQYVGQKEMYRDSHTGDYRSRQSTFSSQVGRLLSAAGWEYTYTIVNGWVGVDREWEEWEDLSKGIRPVSVPKPAPLTCEVTLVCWPAFQGVIPTKLGLYPCEYRLKDKSWYWYHKCRCEVSICTDRASIQKCCIPRTVPIGGYRVPIPDIPGCLGCEFKSLSGRRQDYPAGWVESTKTFPKGVCTCLMDTCRAFPRTLCYTAAGPNSNTGASCVAQKCNLTLALPKGVTLDGVLGWNTNCPPGFVSMPSPGPFYEAR